MSGRKMELNMQNKRTRTWKKGVTYHLTPSIQRQPWLSTLFSKVATTNGWGTVKSLIEIWTDLVFYSSLLTFSLIFVTLTRAVPGPRTFSCNVFSNNMKSRDSLQFGGQGKIKRRLARLKLSLSNLLILTKWLFAKIPFAQTQQYVHCLRLNVISKCRLESLASSSGYISDQR